MKNKKQQEIDLLQYKLDCANNQSKIDAAHYATQQRIIKDKQMNIDLLELQLAETIESNDVLTSKFNDLIESTGELKHVLLVHIQQLMNNYIELERKYDIVVNSNVELNKDLYILQEIKAIEVTTDMEEVERIVASNIDSN